MFITNVTWANDTPGSDSDAALIAAANAAEPNTYVGTINNESTYTVRRQWSSEERAQAWIDYVLENFSPVSTSITSD